MGKPTKKQLDAAVRAARLYAGSDGKVRARDAEKLYRRMMRAVATVARAADMAEADVLEQIMDRALGLGPIIPIPGRDI